MVKCRRESEGAEKCEREIPLLVVQQFSMESLHLTMINNGCQILGMYDEMSIMYGQLDAYKHSGSRLDRSTLLDLYNGGSWSRNFKNREQTNMKMPKTAFNMCGFIQPSFVCHMLSQSDPDAFNDRQFFICPGEVEYKYHQLKVPMDESVIKLEDMFKKIKNAHSSNVVYSFDQQAQDAFEKMHDDLCEKKEAIIDDENRRGILSKAKGQLARIAMVIHSIQNTLDIDSDGEWNAIIDEASVQKAKIILDYIIEVKFALMPPEKKINPPSTSLIIPTPINTGSPIIDGNTKYLSKFLSFNEDEILASGVSKYRLVPPSKSQKNNKYPVEECRLFMREVSTASIEERGRDGTSRKTVLFKKRPYTELGDTQHNILKKLHLNEEMYNSSANSSGSVDSFMLETDDSGTDETIHVLSTPDSQEQ